MQRLEVSGAVRHIYGSLGVKRLTYRFLPDPCQMGPIGCPETSVRNYHCMPRNSTEERSSRAHVFFYVLEESTRKLLVSIQEIEGSIEVDKMAKL